MAAEPGATTGAGGVMLVAKCWRCKCVVDVGDYWFWFWVCPAKGCHAINEIKEVR